MANSVSPFPGKHDDTDDSDHERNDFHNLQERRDHRGDDVSQPKAAAGSITGSDAFG